MKHGLLVLLFLCRGWVLSAQLIPQFLLPMWFEDAAGNKDTIWVGGDPAASYQNINPQFGEIALTTPFDSVFEVRAVHGGDYDWETSKIIVDINTSGFCYLGSGTRIMIHAKYPPVKIKWDKDVLAANAPCDVNMVLTPDVIIYLIQNWYEARVIFCLTPRDSIVTDLDFGLSPSQSLNHDFPVEGQGIKNLPGLWFSGFWDAPHCLTSLSESSLSGFSEKNFQVFPNPTSGFVTVQSPFLDRVEAAGVWDMTGKAVKPLTFSASGPWELDLSALLPGFYLIGLKIKGGGMVFKKVVVG